MRAPPKANHAAVNRQPPLPSDDLTQGQATRIGPGAKRHPTRDEVGILGQQGGQRVADGLAVHLAGDQGGRVVGGALVDVQLVVVAGEDQVAA